MGLESWVPSKILTWLVQNANAVKQTEGLIIIFDEW